MSAAGTALPRPRCFWEPYLRDAGRRSKDTSAGSFQSLNLHSGDDVHLLPASRQISSALREFPSIQMMTK